MKKVIITLMFMIVARNVALGQTNFHANITNLWYQGYKTNVLAIANTRLAVNSNDIAGLILKAEYDLEFLEMGTISNSFQRLLQVGDTITTTNFVKRFKLERDDYVDILDWLREDPIPANELPNEKAKGNIIHKELSTGLLEALQKDGYFQ